MRIVKRCRAEMLHSKHAASRFRATFAGFVPRVLEVDEFVPRRLENSQSKQAASQRARPKACLGSGPFCPVFVAVTVDGFVLRNLIADSTILKSTIKTQD